MQGEIIFQTELTAQVKVSRFHSYWNNLLLKGDSSVSVFFLTFSGPENTNIYVLDYFLQTKVQFPMLFVWFWKDIFSPSLLFFAFCRYHCLFVEFVRPDNGCKSPPLDPASTHHLPARDKVRCSLNYESSPGESCAESPPCRRVPPRTLPLTWLTALLTSKNQHMMTLWITFRHWLEKNSPREVQPVVVLLEATPHPCESALIEWLIFGWLIRGKKQTQT